jgi:pyruvate formate lyase activating enzyme
MIGAPCPATGYAPPTGPGEGRGAALAAPAPERSRAHHLRIGGLTPLTTVDYPGELAAVVFCQGCPWRCRYCHNGHLLPARANGLIAWSGVLTFLQRRRQLLDAVVFGGGEPTLQSALPFAMAEAKAMGYKIGLHTAGPYPERLRRLLPHIDWVGLDIKALPGDYPTITGISGSGEHAWESLNLLLHSDVRLQVRTTPMPGLDSENYLGRLRRRLLDAGVRRHVIQMCRTDESLGSALPEVRPSVMGRPDAVIVLI